LVVVDMTVLPKGNVGKVELVSCFDKDAAEAVTSALMKWRFIPVDKSPGVHDCDECVRIARFTFEYSLANGTARVMDLAAIENERRLGLKGK